jgi:two-component system sensor histidine kinase RegB
MNRTTALFSVNTGAQREQHARNRAARAIVAGLFAADDAPPALLAGVAALARLRICALVGQIAAIAVALAWSVALPIVPMGIVIGALLAFAIRTRNRLARGTPATHHEIFAHVTIDVTALSVLLFWAGGETNPFVLLYFVHVVMMALLLPPRQAIIGVGLVIVAAAVVAVVAPHLVHVDGTPLAPSIVAFGWSLSFALTAGITAWLVVRVVASLHLQSRNLAEARRIAANDEAMLRIGALAAGAAHELGSPLGTMAIVVGEMQRSATSDAERHDSEILAAQIAACRHTLARLLACTGRPGTDGGGAVALDKFIGELLDRFRATRPRVSVVVSNEATRASPRIFADAALGQALLNLLNNAADASRSTVTVTFGWDDGELRFTVDDDGPGISDAVLAKLGRERFTTKPPGEGAGLGLLLTATVIGRLGGSVRWSNRTEGGARVDVRLPLAALTLEESFS